MTSLLMGLSAFSDAWERIATELLAGREKWDFSKAPAGATAKIVDIEFAAMFVTAANRAVKNNGLFERASFAKAFAEAELRPHRLKPSKLTPAQREKQKRRIHPYIAADMDVMIEFGLFENTEDQFVYRITKKGEEIYDHLNQTSIDDFLSRSNGEHVSIKTGNGVAGRSDPEVSNLK